MKTSSLIDKIQRKINSFLFRIILVIYSLSILLLFENLFPTIIYVISFIIYLFLYFSFRKKHILRLLNDFILIIMISFGKNPNEIFIFMYILLPILNCSNFSGIKKSNLLFPYTILTFYLLELLYIGRFDIMQTTNIPILSIIFLWLIETYTSKRKKVQDFIESVNDFVDDFYLKKEYLEKPQKIYPELIKKINDKFKILSIEDIFCFISVKLSAGDDKLILINSSKFIWDSKLNDQDFVRKLNKSSYLSDINIEIGEYQFQYNIILRQNIEKEEYVFILTTNKKLPFYYELIGFISVLKPIFAKIAKIILSERNFEELERKELHKLSQRSLYVTRATKAMHHIRNRLTPINNLIRMLDNRDSISRQQIDEFDQLFKVEKERARYELEQIVIRANYLLEKSNNPFNFSEKKPFNLMNCYIILGRNLNVHFPEVGIDLKFGRNISKDAYVYLNHEGFELFLTDWLNNMYKYNNKKLKFVFEIKENILSIEFWNNYLNNREDDVQKMISDLMSKERNEIMKRTTHGLYQIKTCLEEMEIDYQISKIKDESDYVCLVINLKINEDENSNI